MASLARSASHPFSLYARVKNSIAEVPTPEDSKHFCLTKEYNIVFTPEAPPPPKAEAREEEKKTLPWSSLAGTLSPQHWRTPLHNHHVASEVGC